MSASLVENQVKIAYLTSSLVVARDFLSTLKRHEDVEEHKERHKIFPASDKIRFMELCTNHKFDLFVIEEEFIDCEATEWMGRIDKVLALKEFGARPPVILIGSSEKTSQDIRKSLSQGFQEIILKPIDMPILLQAVDRCLPGKNILAEPQLFKMSASDTVNVAIPMVFEGISETEITILGESPYKPGDVVCLYSKAFDEGGNKEVVAVCSSSHPMAPNSPKYRSTFTMQGVTPGLTRNIRKWIQITSAKQKSA